MMTKSLQSIKQKLADWLLQGVSPQRLALTIALGLAIGCIPFFGVASALCIVVALVLRLNYPVIQTVNLAMMPLQVTLILPFMRLGERLFGLGSSRAIQVGSLLHTSPSLLISQLSGLAGHAVMAWLLIAIPSVMLMTTMLTMMLRRVPAMAEAEAGD
ncbi:MAG: DUF2062 domain-containing protein [Terracidiphilus sp.]|jgi:uncharacterized protein (DUF2062 family)